MAVRIPRTYDLEALKRDLAKVEEELKVFRDMIENLTKRKVELELMIETIEKEQAKEEHQG